MAHELDVLLGKFVNKKLLEAIKEMVQAAQKIELQINEIENLVDELILAATWYPEEAYGSSEMIVPTHLIRALDEKINENTNKTETS